MSYGARNRVSFGLIFQTIYTIISNYFYHVQLTWYTRSKIAPSMFRRKHTWCIKDNSFSSTTMSIYFENNGLKTALKKKKTNKRVTHLKLLADGKNWWMRQPDLLLMFETTIHCLKKLQTSLDNLLTRTLLSF